MSGRRAAYKVAMKNARRNRKRTIFLVLLVAVPVAFALVVAGIVRASTLTPQENAQSYFGGASAVVQIWADDPAVNAAVGQWVEEAAEDISSEVDVTRLSRTGIRVGDGGYAGVWDLNMSDPVTQGMLVQVSGDAPVDPAEVAISPTLAEELEVRIGDNVEFENLPVGELEVVGHVSEPFYIDSRDILLAPGVLAQFFDDPDLAPGSALHVSGADAENVAMQIQNLWYEEGQREFWPEPAVDPKPAELDFVDDPMYVLLTESEIEELVEIARTAQGSEEEVQGEVWARIDEMVYSNNYRMLPDIYVETRSQWMAPGLEGTPGLISTAAAAIMLVEVAFVTGAAFAAGTRRRLREIGLMGANGASAKHVRATVVGEGLTIGAVGAGLGVVLGLAVLSLARPILQRFVSRVITGLGIGFLDVLGPVLVALIAVLLAVLIPARTASKVPTTAALQGRMPALSPRRWVVPVGIAVSAAGFLLMSVALVSSSNYAGVLVGVGAVAVVGGVAMMSSPILAGLTKLSDRVPATSRLVLRDSGRNRTRSAVAVAAIMVILLAPITAMTTSATTEERNLVFGLPDPGDHVVLRGSYSGGNLGGVDPLTDADVATLAGILPEDDVAVFDTLDLRVQTDSYLGSIEAGDAQWVGGITDGYQVAVANDELARALDDPGVASSIENGEIVILGIEDRETRVEIDGAEHAAHEHPVAVVQWQMPRILIPESMAPEFADAETSPLALFTLERPLTDDESRRMWASELDVNGAHGHIDPSMIYLIAGGTTLLVVLIVVALVTAVSAAEVDSEIRTIVAVGAPGSIRRRFLGLLTGYQTLVAMALALPLGLGLVWVLNSSVDYVYGGPFGVVDPTAITIPWAWIIPFALALPAVIGLLTFASVRSAPVTPPRRAT